MLYFWLSSLNNKLFGEMKHVSMTEKQKQKGKQKR